MLQASRLGLISSLKLNIRKVIESVICNVGLVNASLVTLMLPF